MRRRLGRWLTVALVSVVMPLLLIELGLRVYQRVTLGVPIFRFGLRAASGDAVDPNTPVTPDARLGWRPSAGYQFYGEARDSDGNARPLSVTQGPHGLRTFGDPAARRPKLLALGDSFTQALCVSAGDTYYDRLGKLADLETFGGGASGWGTLQETQYLEELLGVIKPDLIVWQVSYNDFMDNDFELGQKWRAGCQSSIRPYWEHGKVTYRYSCHGSWATFTRLGYLLTTRLDRLRAQPPAEDELLQEILRQGDAHPGFARAVATTSSIFDELRARAGGIPIVLFQIDTSATPFFPAMKRLATEHGFYFVDDLPEVLGRAHQEGKKVLCEDKVHYNAEGHRLIAEALARALGAHHLPLKR